MGWNVDSSTGLLGHFIGTINSSIFTTDSNKADPNAPFLSWHVTVDDVLQENFTGAPPDNMVVNLTIGKGWVESEDGTNVEHKDGVESFKASSVYGRIVALVAGSATSYGAQAVVLDGDGDAIVDFKAVQKYMADNGFDDPRVATIWEGLTFEFRGIGFKFKKDDGDPYQLTLPTRLASK